MVELIKKIYDEAFGESHLAGLQAVWHAAVAHTKAELAEVEHVAGEVVIKVEKTVSEAVSFVTGELELAPVAEAPVAEAPVAEAPVAEAVTQTGTQV
jgi:hypothetical protein